MEKSFAKPLTRNDLGLTGGHQGGICVPKADKALLDFFPRLNEGEINPESWIECIDPNGKSWKMRYVYYNGKLHGTSSRNEFRITYMTTFFKEWNAAEANSVVFKSTIKADTFYIHIEKPVKTAMRVQEDLQIYGDSTPTIILKGWRRIH